MWEYQVIGEAFRKLDQNDRIINAINFTDKGTEC